jgi:hypothetical protein
VIGLSKAITVDPSAASYVGPNDIPSDSIYLDIGPTYAYVHGLTMPNNGIIYIMIGEDAGWRTDPTISEMKRGIGPNGYAPAFFKILGYRTAEPNSSSATFVGSGTKNLRLYIMGADDNPFEERAYFGVIRKFVIEAEIPVYGVFLRLSIFIMIFMLFF